MNGKSLAALCLALASTHCGPRSATHGAHAPTRTEIGSPAWSASPVSHGDSEAVALLEALLHAVRDEDVARVARCFAHEPIQLGSANATVTSPMRQDLAVQRIVGARHASGLDRTTPIDAMIDRMSITTTAARRHFSSLPPGLHHDDVVVTFRVRPLAARALLAIASRGDGTAGMIVVRVLADGARVVAL